MDESDESALRRATLREQAGSTPMERWRNLGDQIKKAHEAFRYETLRVATQYRVIHQKVAPKKTFEPLLQTDERSTILRKVGEWALQLSAKQNEKVREEGKTLIDTTAMNVAEGHLYDLQRAREEQAGLLEEPLVGPDACWRLATSVGPMGWNQTDNSNYARASAALSIRRLRRMGYHARGARRGEAYEVWAWTCAEGIQICAKQQKPESLGDELRAAMDEGVNPSALYHNFVPITLVIAANADRCARPGRRVAVDWTPLAKDEVPSWPTPGPEPDVLLEAELPQPERRVFLVGEKVRCRGSVWEVLESDPEPFCVLYKLKRIAEEPFDPDFDILTVLSPPDIVNLV